MGILNKNGKNVFIDDSTVRAWYSSLKRIEFDRKTFLPLGAKAPVEQKPMSLEEMPVMRLAALAGMRLKRGMKRADYIKIIKHGELSKESEDGDTDGTDENEHSDGSAQKSGIQ